MIAFLKLIRLPNLLIIALAQYAMRFGVIKPMIEYLNSGLIKNYPELITNPHIITLQVSELNFFLLVLSTVMIAAAGYIINDYFDVRIDRINKPNDIVIDKGVKRRVAMGAHFTISAIAAFIAVGVSYKLGMLKYSVIFLLYIIGLWFYSTDFKKQFLIGNLLVALFVGSVPLIVGIYEMPLLVQKHDVLMMRPFLVEFKLIFMFILGFSLLAFLITFIREVIKDIEDMEGDAQFGCRTIPIVLGIDTSKNLISFLTIVTIIIIGSIQQGRYSNGDMLAFWYLLIFIQLPLAYIIYSVTKSTAPKDFKIPDRISKVVMLTGILYSALVYYSFMYNAG